MDSKIVIVEKLINALFALTIFSAIFLKKDVNQSNFLSC